jgi:hypothetical protein
MKINYNVTGNERKNLVKLISEITEVPSKYLGFHPALTRSELTTSEKTVN